MASGRGVLGPERGSRRHRLDRVDRQHHRQRLRAGRARLASGRAGQLSLHDGGVLHGSAGNPSARLRAGLAVRYITPDARQRGPRPSAMLVRGVDAVGYYRHQPAPRFDFDPVARAWHARSLRQYAARVVWQALRRPSPHQLAMLARALRRRGTVRALWGRGIP